MRINIFIFVVTILIGAGFTLWLDQKYFFHSPQENPTPVTGQPSVKNQVIPDFILTSIDEKTYSIGDFHDKLVVLNFWATWCTPCIVEFPKLVQLAQKNPDLVLITLSSDIDNQKIKQFLKKYPANAPNIIVARDNKGKITRELFGTYKLPETIIIAPNRTIVKKIIGDTEWNSKEMQDFLDGLKS